MSLAVLFPQFWANIILSIFVAVARQSTGSCQTVMNIFVNYCSAYGLRAFSVLFLFSVTEETCSIYLRDQMPKTADFQANFSVKMMRVTRVQDVNGQALPQEERIKSRKLPQGGQNIYEVSLAQYWTVFCSLSFMRQSSAIDILDSFDPHYFHEKIRLKISHFQHTVTLIDDAHLSSNRK